MAKTNKPLIWDTSITIKLRASQRSRLAQIDPARPLTHVIREAIDSYLERKNSQNVDSPAV